METAGQITPESGTRSLVRLLGQHYGDRTVYLRDPRDHLLLKDAISRGLVSASGRLTSRGYAWWQRHECGPGGV
ncbi:MAG TPA: hypothetical protein VIT83_06255 [Gammaproteobacteria bacterium]